MDKGELAQPAETTIGPNKPGPIFHLTAQQVERVCLFDLSWGQGQRLGVQIPYPDLISHLYQDWQQMYLGFYQQALRGRVERSGKVAPIIDWHARLVQAEAKLLYQFHRWLRHEELYEIRATIARAVSQSAPLTEQPGAIATPVNVFLTATPLDLARLPWEAWEIGTEFTTTEKIRIVRKPLNIRGEPPASCAQDRSRRIRVLAILGDETGLDFQADKDAVRSLSSMAEIQFVGWQPGKQPKELRTDIALKIADRQGWDVLFFAGHSNEADLVGGELAIGPNISLYLNELIQPLTLAKERGLQFAIFNSCKGLNLANTLIDLGLCQVAVMREPVHNQVAQEFLRHFLRGLASYQDAHDALLSACQFLKLEKQLTYPSAYLIPSLFRHPNAPVFRLRHTRWSDRLKQWKPRKLEAVALAAVMLASFQGGLQSFLLDRRVFAQAVYRQLTHQVPAVTSPPVVMVGVDEEFIKRNRISNPKPFDRQFLAQIIDRLAAANAPIIGIDYLLDRYQADNDAYLATAIQNAIEQHQVWFVFVSRLHEGNGCFVDTVSELASPNWSLNGDMSVLGDLPAYMVLLPPPLQQSLEKTCPRRLPFSYLLALSYQMHREPLKKLPQPQLNASTQWLAQVKVSLTENTGQDYQTLFSHRSNLNPVTGLAYRLNQWWLHPIVDYSIPPQQIYQWLPAWKLLENPPETLALPSEPFIALIAPWGYGEAGINQDGEDNFPVPWALDYWRTQANSPEANAAIPEKMPGAEVHAYMTDHFLNQRFVIPIPDLWMVLVFALVGQGAAIAIRQAPRQQIRWMFLLIGATGLYGLLSLQFYTTGALLIPFSLPMVILWIYVLSASMEKKFYG
ncbi:MAG: CHASE2 domain-containing protein [Oscillatoriales cyanobacterium RM2_1_1]|nr:CHASE2 domain-containing protein [Oscillatoriales cyanobacterium SM2_3_0]NJO45353.1 CHASE2 domain-containing protein [Oscillatoriales cyanobacterium RM2_1_1]